MMLIVMTGVRMSIVVPKNRSIRAPGDACMIGITNCPDLESLVNDQRLFDINEEATGKEEATLSIKSHLGDFKLKAIVDENIALESCKPSVMNTQVVIEIVPAMWITWRHAR